MMNTALKLVLLFAMHKSALGDCSLHDGSCKGTKPGFNDEVSLLTVKTQLHKARDVAHEAEKEDSRGNVGAEVEEWAPNNNCEDICRGDAGGGQVGCFGPASTGECNRYFVSQIVPAVNLAPAEVLMCRNTQGVHEGCRVHGSHHQGENSGLAKRHSPFLQDILDHCITFDAMMIPPNPAIVPVPPATTGCEEALRIMGPDSQLMSDTFDSNFITSAEALYATTVNFEAIFEDARMDEAHLRLKQDFPHPAAMHQAFQDNPALTQHITGECAECARLGGTCEGCVNYQNFMVASSEAELQHFYDRSHATAEVYHWLQDTLTNNPMDAVQFAQFRTWLGLYCSAR